MMLFCDSSSFILCTESSAYGRRLCGRGVNSGGGAFWAARDFVSARALFSKFTGVAESEVSGGMGKGPQIPS